jgi:hypothetical protein
MASTTRYGGVKTLTITNLDGEVAVVVKDDAGEIQISAFPGSRRPTLNDLYPAVYDHIRVSFEQYLIPGNEPRSEK